MSSSEHEKAAEQGTPAWSSSDISCGNRDFASPPWFAAVSSFPGFLMQTSSVLRHLLKHARCQWCETNIAFHLISSLFIVKDVPEAIGFLCNGSKLNLELDEGVF